MYEEQRRELIFFLVLVAFVKQTSALGQLKTFNVLELVDETNRVRFFGFLVLEVLRLPGTITGHSIFMFMSLRSKHHVLVHFVSSAVSFLVACLPS